MSWNNYPPGVTGNEYEIAGPDFETTEETECDCGFKGEVEVEGFHGVVSWTCPQCETDHEEDRSEP